MSVRAVFRPPIKLNRPNPSSLKLAPISSSVLQQRTFFSLPSSSAQHLTATRNLPYSRSPLYDLISDVDSYSHFVPHCSTSQVTRWSEPTSQDDRRYPTMADLHVGWGGMNEVFTSELRCVPGLSVEAISGGKLAGGDGAGASAVFESLVTKWTLSDLSQGRGTRVHLDIKYQFANPLYAVISAAISEKIAGTMIEAFEKRAQQTLGPTQT